jgi:glycosyltransferase involved in cell wall biosynthesis
MSDGEPSDRPVPVTAVPRSRPFVLRYPQVAAAGIRLARHADVIYATATYAAAAAAAVGARRPLVAKLVSDPAYERARRYRLFAGTLEEFQSANDPRLRALKALRNASLRRAHTIVVPSTYLAVIARSWSLATSRIHVLVNPAPSPDGVVAEPLPPGTFVFIGRLTEQKALTVALAALVRVPGARLVIIGDGPERVRLERFAQAEGVAGRVEFLGSLPRDDTLRYAAGARAALLSSAWENLPHSAVEALAMGTPVVATAVGGVAEVVHDGENGLLVPPGDPAALAGAMKRVLEDDKLRDRLAAAARPSIASIGREAIYGRLETLLAKAAT